MLDHIDRVLKFFAECPGSKRGRPMKPENAQRLAKTTPDAVCTKKTSSGKIVHYRTAPKGKAVSSKKKKSLWERVFGGKKKIPRKSRVSKSSPNIKQLPSETEQTGSIKTNMDTAKISNDLSVLKDIMSTLRPTQKTSGKKGKIASLKERFAKFKAQIVDWKRRHPVTAKVALPIIKIAMGAIGIPIPFQAKYQRYMIYRLNRLDYHIQMLEDQKYGHRTRIYRMEKNAKFFATAGGQSNQC